MTEFSACPGMIHTGAWTLRPLKVSSTTSSFGRLSASASFGLTSAALSQVSFVMGLGSSCNQPLLANRPSHTAGSGLKTSSSHRVDASLRGRPGITTHRATGSN